MNKQKRHVPLSDEQLSFWPIWLCSITYNYATQNPFTLISFVVMIFDKNRIKWLSLKWPRYRHFTVLITYYVDFTCVTNKLLQSRNIWDLNQFSLWIYIIFIVSDKDTTNELPLLHDSNKAGLNHGVTSKPIADDTLKYNWKRRKKQRDSPKKYPGKVMSLQLFLCGYFK